MSTPAHDPSVALELSRPEAWVVHSALLDHARRVVERGETPRFARTLLRRIEAGEYTFDRAGLQFLAEVLSTYLDDAPDRDCEVAVRLIERIEGAMA